MKFLFFIVGFFCINSQIYAQLKICGIVSDSAGFSVAGADVYLVEHTKIEITDANGKFCFNNLPAGKYNLLISAIGFSSASIEISINTDSLLKIGIYSLEIQAPTVTVNANEKNGLEHFRSVDWDNMIIGAGKKSEIISLDRIEANLAANNSRQIYAKIAGLNIWENDNSGIQLNIGGRGLSPNRTSNFNTRQNGYDISADALGYPESYYTPPAQALERIEIIRGAASLQFGTQFGGLLNFKMKEGDKNTPLLFSTENSYGSFNFFNSFNSIGGTVAKGKLNYFAYYQYKRGDGWRPFSEYEVHNGYAALNYQWNARLNIRLEQSTMHYLARQPGGLTDAEFNNNPRQSKRPRNWFKVNWNISALSFDYQISEKTKFNSRTFLLWSDRQSLGNLAPINRVDYGGDRDLIKGFYRNIGNESRLMHRYKIAKNVQATALAGFRIYKGFTEQQQGFSNSDSSGTLEDFQFNAGQGLLRSDYKFPSFNAAFFAENYIALGKKFGITPGIRYEYIRTEAKGYYQDLLVLPGPDGFDTLRNEAVFESKSLPRSIFLAGIGISYRPTEKMELYGNFSQNYRAINFNDMRIVNPNQLVDPELKDESGFNADLGFRGSWARCFSYDLSLFYLSYRRRIGNLQVQRPDLENPTIIELITLRTNIGNASVLGIESLLEWNLIRCFAPKEQDWGLEIFTNFALLDGYYHKSENSAASGKKLEFLAPFTFKSGLKIAYKKFQLSTQLSYTSSQYSDASNSISSANAVVGKIPSYFVTDLSMSYVWRSFRLQAGVNNLFNEMYFTRRAASYPGPGIIPADGRNLYVSLRVELKSKIKKSNS
jgi:Fe(3+) dicitrate transport protein